MSARVEAAVLGVFMHQETELPPQYTFTLSDGLERRMSIFCGQFEAWAISFALDGQTPERPMTHDLTMALLETAGATVTEAAITDLRDETFYATLTLQLADGTVREMDARPSDAMALALRAKCPIFVVADVWKATARQEPEEVSRGAA